jgi:hypothetical protein
MCDFYLVRDAILHVSMKAGNRAQSLNGLYAVYGRIPDHLHLFFSSGHILVCQINRDHMHRTAFPT